MVKMHVKIHVHWTSTSVQSSLPSAIRVGAWTHGRPPTRAQAKVEPGKNVSDRMQTLGLREGYWSNHGLAGVYLECTPGVFVSLQVISDWEYQLSGMVLFDACGLPGRVSAMLEAFVILAASHCRLCNGARWWDGEISFSRIYCKVEQGGGIGEILVVDLALPAAATRARPPFCA